MAGLSVVFPQGPQRRRRRWRSVVRVFWRAYRLWDRHDCIDLSAAFAYHSLQSFFPFLLIALAVASRILGHREGLENQILDWAAQVLPPSALPLVRSTLLKLVRQGTGAGLLGVSFLLVTAGNAYLSLQRGADRLWGFRTSMLQAIPWQRAVARFIRARVEAFGLVLLIGLLVVADQVTTNLRLLNPGSWRSWILSGLPSSIRVWVPVPVVLDVLMSLVIACGLAFLLLRVLPTRGVPHRPLIPGAMLIGVSLTALNFALGRSLISLGARFQAYGVIGGVLVLTLWVWLVALIVYYGTALSVVLSHGPMGGGASTPEHHLPSGGLGRG